MTHRKVKILQIDPGGEQYVALARALAFKAPVGMAQHLVFPNATVIIHSYQTQATVRIETGGLLGWLGRFVDLDTSAFWVGAEILTAGSTGTPAANQVELPFGTIYRVDTSGTAVAEVYTVPASYTNRWTQVTGVDAAARPGTVAYAEQDLSPTTGSPGNILTGDGWDRVRHWSPYAPLGLTVWADGARLYYRSAVVNRSTAGITTASGDYAYVGRYELGEAASASMFGQNNAVQVYADLTNDPGVHQLFTDTGGSGFAKVTSDIPLTLSVLCTGTSAWLLWADTTDFRVYKLTAGSPPTSSLKLSQAADITVPGYSTWIPARTLSNGVIALLPVFSGANKSAYVIDMTVDPPTKALFGSAMEVFSVLYVAPGVCAVVGTPVGETGIWVRTITMSTGATIEQVKITDLTSAFLDYYESGTLRWHGTATSPARFVWATQPVSDAGVIGSPTREELPSSTAEVGYGWV